VRSRSWVALVALAAATLATVVLAAEEPALGKSARGSRRASPRTGKLAPAFAEMVKAHKRGDRAALGRVAERLGPARLGEAVAHPDAAIGAAALAAAPLARGGVLLTGPVSMQLWAADPTRASAAASALASLLDGSVPTLLEEWDVPPDAIARACEWLRGIAGRTESPLAVRLAVLDAVAATMPTCGPADVAALVHDPAPAIRRAAVLIAAGARQDATVQGAIADGDRAVSGAAAASACRLEARSGEPRNGSNGRPQPPSPAAQAAARAQAGVPGTAPDDAVEMLDCLASAGTPADRALLDELQRRPPSPLRDRAVELAGARATAQ
jgi:hypothetical protein